MFLRHISRPNSSQPTSGRVFSALFRVLAVCLLVCAVAWAQTTTEGALGGTVSDATGAVIAGATVVVHNNATNAERSTKSDASGAYRIGNLAPANYSVTITAGGFAPYKAQQVTINVGTVTELSPKLAVGASNEVVEVTGEAAPQVNTSSSEFSGIVNNVAISNLPINGNRWSNFVLLTPTVVANGDGFGLVSFRGMSVLLNNNTVDGADNNQAFFSEERGRTRAGYSTAKSAIQEFQVNTSNYSAEYGRSAGGVVNTVTKSGTNALHGEMYFYDRDNDWGATNPYTTLTSLASLSPTPTFSTVPYKPKDWRKISGFAVGGPIKKDKLFFFVAFDWFKRNFPGTSVPSRPSSFYAAPSAATLTTLGTNLGAAVANCGGSASACYTNGLLGLLSENGPVPRVGEQFTWFPKLDWQINDKHHAVFEVNRMRWASPAGIQTQATNTYGIRSFGNDYVKTTWGVARLDSAFSSTLSNQLRYQYGRDFEFENPQAPTAYESANFVTSPNFPGYTNPLGFPPDVFITNGFDMGVATFLTRPKYPDEYRHQIADTASWSHGKHLVRFGIDFSHVNDTSQNLRYQFGSFSYSSIVNYLSDLYKPNSCGGIPCYSSYQQAFGPLGFQFTTNDMAFFAQDDWKATPRLTLSIGLRYEYEQLPKPFSNLVNPDYPLTGHMPGDKNNWGPRAGFAWDIMGDGKTSLRGGAGIYYGRVINSTIYNALAQTGVSAGQLSYNLSTSSYSAASAVCYPQFPQILNAAPTCPGSKPAVFFFQPNFDLPQIGQLDLTLEREIGWATVVSLSYVSSFGRHLPSFLDVNLNKPTKNITYTVVDANSEGPLAAGTQLTMPVYTGNRPNQKYGPVTDIFSGVNSNYNAMIVQVNHRMNRHVQFSSNLTWARAFDFAQNQQTFTDTNDFLYPTDLHPLAQSYGRSQYDIPLRFVLNAVAESPWRKSGALGYLTNGWQLAPIFQWQKGLPYSLQESGSPSGTTQGGLTGSGTGSGYTSAQGNFSGFNFIPALGRNTFRGPNTQVVDLKLSKIFTYRERYSVELSGEAFNLLNHVNVTGIATTGYLVSGPRVFNGTGTMTYCGTTNACSAVFGSTTNANSNFSYTPRQIQLGVRVKF